jgi:hypothetical protein
MSLNEIIFRVEIDPPCLVHPLKRQAPVTRGLGCFSSSVGVFASSPPPVIRG